MFCCGISAPCLSKEPAGKNQISAPAKKTILLTVPKSGTHLLLKATRMIAGCSLKWMGGGDPRIIPLFFDPEEDLEFSGHSGGVHHTFDVYDNLRDYLEEYNFVLLIRDPRDVFLSEIDWIGKGKPLYYPEDYIQELDMHDLNDRLNIAIQHSNELMHTGRFIEKAIEWMRTPGVLVCRFEDFVGPEGGGSKDVQKRALEELAKHMGYECSEKQINRIARQLFGTSWTFNSGKIGRWRTVYSEENKRMFKKHLGNALILMGYESDLEW